MHSRQLQILLAFLSLCSSPLFAAPAAGPLGAPLTTTAETAGSACYVKKPEWALTMQASREALLASGNGSAQDILDRMENDFPMQWDWLLQDAGDGASQWFDKSKTAEITSSMIRHVVELGQRQDSL